MNKLREPFYGILWKVSVGYNDSWSQIDPDVIEKFAESIILEACKVLDPSLDLTSMSEEIHRDACIVMLEEHFGVKYK